MSRPQLAMLSNLLYWGQIYKSQVKETPFLLKPGLQATWSLFIKGFGHIGKFVTSLGHFRMISFQNTKTIKNKHTLS